MIESSISQYNAAVTISFAPIPACWQTVIASVEFQYGSLQKKCLAFWVAKQFLIAKNTHKVSVLQELPEDTTSIAIEPLYLSGF